MKPMAVINLNNVIVVNFRVVIVINLIVANFGFVSMGSQAPPVDEIERSKDLGRSLRWP